MTTQTLEYARMPSTLQRWYRRLLAAGIVVVSNVVAAGTTVAVLAGAGALCGVGMAIFAALTNSDADGFLEVLVALVFLSLILGIFFTVLALLLAPVIILAGLAADAIRRSLRWPWWTGLLGAAVLGFLVALVFQAMLKTGFLWALVNSILGAAILLAAFCIYWIPLGFAESILRLLRWATESICQWWNRRALERAQPAELSDPPSGTSTNSAGISSVSHTPLGDK